ncbi:uncharacterized protein PHALS_05099 [Plasmopara halstedii]|uniref:Uncharacterized protein n=1 Tax=Plasmopara halstedii TaxID=4781 RepID=A0A0N7L7Q9_PLAHL|nr:uncharacterized protein PHALS_05099 [Plasmopara halstedii]CEG47763.1 hypothetical protein PHALS_05099 [Plasmopara halstedii]|eukprot:XP_024584132.1 hypothetical protein PHALS_05099 [Plasmopara halstedii]
MLTERVNKWSLTLRCNIQTLGHSEFKAYDCGIQPRWSKNSLRVMLRAHACAFRMMKISESCYL